MCIVYDIKIYRVTVILDDSNLIRVNIIFLPINRSSGLLLSPTISCGVFQ